MMDYDSLISCNTVDNLLKTTPTHLFWIVLAPKVYNPTKGQLMECKLVSSGVIMFILLASLFTYPVLLTINGVYKYCRQRLYTNIKDQRFIFR